MSIETEEDPQLSKLLSSVVEEDKEYIQTNSEVHSREREASIISHRTSLFGKTERYRWTCIFDLATRSDMYWNYDISYTKREKCIIPTISSILFIVVICTLVAMVFLGIMVELIGWMAYSYIIPMYIILLISLFMKLALVFAMERKTQLLFLSSYEVHAIVFLTFLYAFIACTPYDYFRSTDSREATNHNSTSIWQEKMVFIAFNAFACSTMTSYCLIFFVSFLKERKCFPQNFGILYDGLIHRPLLTAPTESLLITFFQLFEDLMWQFDLLILIDLFLTAVFLFLLGCTYYNDHIIGPVATSLSFLMGYQFLITLLIFTEINQIDHKISIEYHFLYLKDTRWNKITTHELWIVLGVMTSLFAAVIKVWY